MPTPGGRPAAIKPATGHAPEQHEAPTPLRAPVQRSGHARAIPGPYDGSIARDEEGHGNAGAGRIRQRAGAPGRRDEETMLTIVRHLRFASQTLAGAYVSEDAFAAGLLLAF